MGERGLFKKKAVWTVLLQGSLLDGEQLTTESVIAEEKELGTNALP